MSIEAQNALVFTYLLIAIFFTVFCITDSLKMKDANHRAQFLIVTPLAGLLWPMVFVMITNEIRKRITKLCKVHGWQVKFGMLRCKHKVKKTKHWQKRLCLFFGTKRYRYSECVFCKDEIEEEFESSFDFPRDVEIMLTRKELQYKKEWGSRNYDIEVMAHEIGKGV